MVYPGFTTGPVAPSTSPFASPAPRATPSPGPTPAPAAGTPAAAPGPVPSPSPGVNPGGTTTRLDRPYELNASAGIARQIAADLDKANGKGGNNLAEHASTAAGRIRGFAFGGTLTGSTERWLQQCKTLHDKLTGTADRLDATQRAYQSNETSTAGRFGRPGR
ncbi:hypothetical protein ACFVUH_03425 [Kitasatospora sp. NPDC058032]|uniref:hypothetical protein n=1 Tax=Kitasatospora sp. NPDC058032 TaxID=3346307 RepID=UPI0036DE3392